MRTSLRQQKYREKMQFCSFSIVIANFAWLFACVKANSSANSNKAGAVITLARSFKKTSEFRSLIYRNEMILKHMYSFKNSSVTTNSNPDIVIFHDKDDPISSDMQSYIVSQTPELHFVFRVVSFTGHAIFTDEKKTAFKHVHPMCTPTKINYWDVGYKNMCRFWFIGVYEYLQDYSWALRLDDDCWLKDNIVDLIPNLLHSRNHRNISNIPLIASPAWLPLYVQRSEKINATYEGDVVIGLGQFTRDFAVRHHLNHTTIDSFYAPYTNAMFINLHLLRKNNTNSVFTQRHKDTPGKFHFVVYHVVIHNTYNMFIDSG